MRKIKQVVVTYADGSTETIVGAGSMSKVDTYQVVESWPADKPDAQKPDTTNQPVHYYTIGITPDA